MLDELFVHIAALSSRCSQLEADARTPMQPLALDQHGVMRFKSNAIIDYLFNTRKMDLNELAAMPFPDEDRMQIAQMLGYSLGGYSDLSYVSDESYERAARLSGTSDT